jgi:Polyketide cyclase / dehydrase and lipid transport
MMNTPRLAHHEEDSAPIPVPAERVFAYLDDHARLASHMSRSSWRMGGGRMQTVLDEGRGQAIGSHIRMGGRILGLELALDEVVTERTPPLRKVWETVGTPRLLVIGPYRMAFEIEAQGTASLLRVFIDYELPKTTLSRCLGRLFGHSYARWCAKTMVADAVQHFHLARST